MNWYDLVPDQSHKVVVAGYGTAAPLGGGSVATDTYVTAARTRDHRLVLAYMLTARAVTVDMSQLVQPAVAYWYDPTNGSRLDITGSPWPNSGERTFTPPAQNHDGDGDWVLVLDAN